MYNFYKDPNLRDSFYTKTNECAKNLEYFRQNNSIFEEIFLDNTFGEVTKEKKLFHRLLKYYSRFRKPNYK